MAVIGVEALQQLRPLCTHKQSLRLGPDITSNDGLRKGLTRQRLLPQRTVHLRVDPLVQQPRQPPLVEVLQRSEAIYGAEERVLVLKKPDAAPRVGLPVVLVILRVGRVDIAP